MSKWWSDRVQQNENEEGKNERPMSSSLSLSQDEGVVILFTRIHSSSIPLLCVYILLFFLFLSLIVFVFAFICVWCICACVRIAYTFLPQSLFNFHFIVACVYLNLIRVYHSNCVHICMCLPLSLFLTSSPSLHFILRVRVRSIVQLLFCDFILCAPIYLNLARRFSFFFLFRIWNDKKLRGWARNRWKEKKLRREWTDRKRNWQWYDTKRSHIEC